MFRNMLAAALLLAPAAPAFACSCHPKWVAEASSVAKTIRLETEAAAKRGQPPSVAVVDAAVEGFYTEKRQSFLAGTARPAPAMKLKSLSSGEALVVIGQDGLNCNAQLSAFAVGGRYRFVLRRAPDGFFDLNGCGVYHEALP